MRKPLIKKIFSYFTDILLETSSSEFNETIEVFLSKGRYQLCASEAIYSFEDKYVNFFDTFKRMNWNKLNIEKVLVLGLGLASVPQMLEKKFHKKFEYHVVEIDEEIIRLAQNYVISDLESQFFIYEMDAEIFVDITEDKFDLIIIDIFDNQTVPLKFETLEFLEKAKYLLTGEGILLYNRLNLDAESYEETQFYNYEVFNKVFPESTQILVKTNIILSNRNDIFLE